MPRKTEPYQGDVIPNAVENRHPPKSKAGGKAGVSDGGIVRCSTDFGISDEERAFCAPYLSLMREDAPQREYALRAVFNALRYMVRAGCPWRLLPHGLPPWAGRL